MQINEAISCIKKKKLTRHRHQKRRQENIVVQKTEYKKTGTTAI